MLDTSHFPKASKYWYMGKFHDWSDLTLHPMTFTLRSGSPVFGF